MDVNARQPFRWGTGPGTEVFDMDEKLEKLRELVNNAQRIVFFGGAGVSTESGIPDFRSVDGLYNQHYKFPPETILSRTFLRPYARGVLPLLPR